MRRVAALAVLTALVAVASGAQAGGNGASVAVPRPYALTIWNADSDNVAAAEGTLTLNGSPVSGARIRVDSYELPAPTDASGHFTYLADVTQLARHVVSVIDASGARIAGTVPTQTQRSALARARASISVAYPVRELHVSRDPSGHPVITGRIAYATGGPPPVVSIYSYALSGTVTDANRKPVTGAYVSTRTLDRDYWTISTPTDSRGRYTSLFTASDEAGDNPVPITLRVSKGDVVYQFLPQEYTRFALLQSAKLNVRLPPRGYPMALPQPRSYPGAIYEGIAIGVAFKGTPVRPLRATWPDGHGRFTLVLPRSLAERSVSLWEARLQLFSRTTAAAGGAVDLTQWPATLPADAPRDLARVTLR